MSPTRWERYEAWRGRASSPTIGGFLLAAVVGVAVGLFVALVLDLDDVLWGTVPGLATGAAVATTLAVTTRRPRRGEGAGGR